ncbi:MAG: hypothetical protein ACRC8S_06220 [Fimbriiglobus sp.]
MRHLIQSSPWRSGAFALLGWGLLLLLFPLADLPSVSAWGVLILWAIGRVYSHAAWSIAGWLSLVLHVLIVFELVHGWSHSSAYEATERQSGYGWGVFVNYAVILLWGVEIWWRQPSFSVAVNLLLAFVMFNATVVFGQWPVQVLGGLVFAWLGVVWFLRWLKVVLAPVLESIDMDDLGPNS